MQYTKTKEERKVLIYNISLVKIKIKCKLTQPFKSEQAKLLLDVKYIFLRLGFKNGIAKE